jgi:hypothetical protein
MVVRAGALRAGAWPAVLSLPFLLLGGPPGLTQTPPQNPTLSSPPPAQALPQPKPVTGFVTSYEIMRTVRAAGFEPLAPPLREGTTYVLRATDFRGILMRVVLDARTGVIRDVIRIVSDASGPYGIVAPAYAAPPYGASAEYDAPAEPAEAREEGTAPQLAQPRVPQAAEKPERSISSKRAFVPPLPLPRPQILATPSAEKQTVGTANTAARHGDSTDANPSAATVGINAGAAAPAAQGKTPPASPPIND